MTQAPEHDDRTAPPASTGEESPVVAIVGMVLGAVTFVLGFFIWRAFSTDHQKTRLFKFMIEELSDKTNLYGPVSLYAAVVIGIAFLHKAFRFIAGFMTGLFLGTFPFFVVLFALVLLFMGFAWHGVPIMLLPGGGPPNMEEVHQRVLRTLPLTVLNLVFLIGTGGLLISACVTPRRLKRNMANFGGRLVRPSFLFLWAGFLFRKVYVLITDCIASKRRSGECKGGLAQASSAIISSIASRGAQPQRSKESAEHTIIKWIVVLIVFYEAVVPLPQYLIGIMIASVIAYRVIR
jgi:hypothetical protein